MVKGNEYSSYASSVTAAGIQMPLWDHTVLYQHPEEVIFPYLPEPIKAYTRYSDPGGMQS